MSKAIVFCIDVEHAERMRQALINENKDLYKENNKYIMRITGNNPEGKKQLANLMGFCLAQTMQRSISRQSCLQNLTCIRL